MQLCDVIMYGLIPTSYRNIRCFCLENVTPQEDDNEEEETAGTLHTFR